MKKILAEQRSKTKKSVYVDFFSTQQIFWVSIIVELCSFRDGQFEGIKTRQTVETKVEKADSLFVRFLCQI